MSIKGIICTIFSALLFGITPILASWIYHYGASSITVVFFRSLFVIPILFLIMKSKHIPLTISKHDLTNTAIVALFGSGLTTILLFTSYQYIAVGTATTLHFLYPIFVAIFCYFVYQEKLSKSKVFALSLALLGTLCFFDFHTSNNYIGLMLAIGSAVAYAFYMVQLEKTRLTHLNAFKVSFYMAIFTLCETIVYHLFIPTISFVFPLEAYGLLILLAIVSSFLAVVFLQIGIKELGSSTASLFCLFEPITSIIAGYIFLQESIGISKIIGCFMILSSLILITLAEKRKSKHL
ncbi:MAG: DMT family transporter [Longicatena sp.]